MSRRVAVVILAALVAGAARADDVNGFVEVTAARNRSDDALVGVPETRTETNSFLRRVNVNWTRRIFPLVELRMGAFYERTDDTIDQDGFERESDRSRLRPYARVTLRSADVLLEAGWDRTEDKSRTDDLEPFRRTRDSYVGVASWERRDVTRLRLELTRLEDRDATRRFEDRTQNTARFTAEYAPADTTKLYYRGSVDKDDDAIRHSSFKTTSHAGELRYADLLFDGRWEVGVNWTTAYRKTEIESSGTGELLIPIFPVAGLFLIDDTPDEGILDPAPAVIDGNTLAGTGINLGLPGPGGELRPRNFGMDFGIERDVNLLRIWIDRDLPEEISSTFVWEIWTSPDGRFWNQSSTVASAPFGPFDNRFEVRFPDVHTRWIKVVASPLAATVPNASAYPVILVTECEPFLAEAAGTVGRTVTNTRNLGQASSRFRILESPGLYYETTYYLIDSSPGVATWTLSNGLALHHRFNDVWSVAARAAREDGVDRDRDRVGYLYTASLQAVPTPTLRHNLVMSGLSEDIEGFRTDTHGVYLNSVATLYRGVDVNVGVGSSHNETTNSPTTDTIQVGVGATITPLPILTVNLRYDDRDSTISNDLVPDRKEKTMATEAGFTLNPVPSFYLYASRRDERRTGEVDRTIDALALSWAPFPGGVLRFVVSYSENRNTFLDETNRVFTPTIRWNINGRSYLNVSYQKLSTESDLGTTDDAILSATLRFGF